MIHMPHRSVTRFFVPLLDVLLLLFCVFLLMPMATEESGAARESAEDQNARIASLEAMLSERTRDLQQYEQIDPDVKKYATLKDYAKLQEEFDRLQQEKVNFLKKHLIVRVLDINGENGELTYFDPKIAEDDKRNIKIDSARAAKDLIDRLTKEAGDREQYFQFLLPRNSGYPTRSDREKYQQWFESVAHSLKK